jgi:hypothetical protein
MNEDRMMIADAVIAGQLDESYLTQDEIDFLFERACDLATEKLMQEAELRGCSVFYGLEGGDTLQ